MTERKTCVLPDPLSPTTPTLSPSPIVKLTWSAASTSPSGVAKRVVRSLTSRTGVNSGFHQQDAVLPEHAVAGHQREPLQAGLGDEHAVERVGVMRRQGCRLKAVAG